MKIVDGGYVPLLLAASVYGLMFIWHSGAAAVSRGLQERLAPVDQFMASVATADVPRVPGTALFLTRSTRDTSPVMAWHVKRNRALHKRLLALTVQTQSIPRVAEKDRLSVEEVAPGFWRVMACYGFMERPDLPALLLQLHAEGCGIDLDDVT